MAVWGGEKPHIGAVAVAQPRPSLKDPDKTSASASVFCFLGHKEEELAKATAEILSATLNTPVVVTAGIHWDNLTQDGIQAAVRNCETLVDIILRRRSEAICRQRQARRFLPTVGHRKRPVLPGRRAPSHVCFGGKAPGDPAISTARF